MKKLMFIFCSLLLTYQFSFSQNAGPNIWTQTYNNQGRIYAIFVNPANTNIMYEAGLDSGIYKSTNAGLNWFNINGTIAYPKFLCMGICAGSPNVIYVGTDQNGATNSGVYKSTDAGATWTFLINGISDTKAIQSIAVHPTNPNIAYIAVFDGVNAATVGVFKTTDGGNNWAAANTGITNMNILTVLLNPANPNTVYAGSSLILPGSTGPSTMYKSYDAGAHWILMSTGLPTGATTGNPIRAMSMSTLDTNIVLASLFMNDTTGGTYFTNNGGTTWTKKWGIPNTTGTLSRACLIKPGSNSEFYIGVDQSAGTGLMGVYRSTDQGASWVDFSGGVLLNSYPIRALTFKTAPTPTLYAGASSATIGAARGIFEYSFPVPSAWTEQTSGITTALYSVSAVDDNVAWTCGSGGKVLKTTNSGANWVNVSSNIPVGNELYNIFAWSSTVALVTTSPAAGGSVTIWKTSNGGTNWVSVYTRTSSAAFGDALWMTDANNAYYYGDPQSSNWDLLKSTNGGDNWVTWATVPAGTATGGWNNAMFIQGTNVWLGTNVAFLAYSSNMGVNWTTQTTPAANQYVTYFVNGTNGLSGGAAMYQTTNTGTNWTSLTSPATSNISGIAGNGSEWWFCDQAATPKIYYSSDNGTSWAAQYQPTTNGGVWYHMTKARTGTTLWAVRSAGGISRYGQPITGIHNITSTIPDNYNLSQNYPNPFNPVTKINFAIPKAGFVTLKIYDILGREVNTLVNESVKAGNYSVEFNGTALSSGVYFYRLISDNFIDTKKMMLIK